MMMMSLIKVPKLRVLSLRGRRAQHEDLHAALLLGKLDGSRDRRNMEVPKGCLAVYVGDDLRRFVIPASYLCQPEFRALMEKVAEEFGFEQTGGLRIPCNEEAFEEILHVLGDTVARNKKKKNKKKDDKSPT
ncbi:Small auxin-up RNA protein [Dioscorea alata]|uniref:Small auxin-up RNA protein n=1 Tax=Dioscorea alata TaxID=55571 RepID=A0ACB7WJ77_DIOAL|nr:Small auxin-up RNA protein [Dioscorea alata]